MKPISPELIQKYLKGNCSLEEEALVLNWYNSFESMADPYYELSPQQQEDLKDRMLRNIESEIGESPNEKHGGIKYLRYFVYLIAGAAAIFLILNTPRVLNTTTNNQFQANNSSIPDEQIIITNKTKTIYKQILPDNSIVWLSPDAQIKYHKIFKKNLREITLSGESFFEVTKDKKHPFVIYSDNITTRVWGTSFRVRDIKNAATAEVAVITGKVSVEIAQGNKRGGLFRSNSSSISNVMLLPKQMVTYKKVENNLQIGKTNKTPSLSIWEKTDLSFDKIPLGDVIHTLNKQYHVEIILHDKKLENLLLRADLNDQSLPDVLEMLKKSLKLTYVTDGKKFTLQRDYTR